MSKTQKTIYIDKEKDKDLIDYIGSNNFSSTMMHLAKIGAQIEKLGVSDIMRGLMVARLSETDALKRALEIVLEHKLIDSVPASASLSAHRADPVESHTNPQDRVEESQEITREPTRESPRTHREPSSEPRKADNNPKKPSFLS